MPNFFKIIDDKQQYLINNPMIDKYIGSGSVLKNYIKKYGRSVKKEIIMFSNSFEENNINEKNIIGDLWKTDPLCENLLPGSGGVTDESLPSRIVKNYYIDHVGGMKGKCHSQESIEKIKHSKKEICKNELYRLNLSLSRKKYLETHVSPNKGRKTPEHIKQKLSAYFKNRPNIKNRGEGNGMYGKVPKNACKVIQCDVEGNKLFEFESIRAAADSVGVLSSNLSKYLNTNKIYNGYIWKRK